MHTSDVPAPAAIPYRSIPRNPARPPLPLSLRNRSKACCSSSGLPRRFTTPPALTGINAAKERSRLFPFEGRAGMWCSPVPAPSTDTRADPASARRAAGPARGRVGRAGGPLWCGPSLGAWGLFRSERLPTYSRLIAHNCSNNRPRTSLLLRAARVLATPASTAEGPRFPRRQGRRATGRPSPPRSRG